MKRQVSLEAVNKKILKCKICPIGKVGLAVVGEGNPDADIVFVGEAPGKEEAKTGRPFIGRSGKFLRKLIASAELVDTDVFITSVVKYLPEYITPTQEDIDHGRIHLLEQLSVIKPRLVVLLGRTAAKGLLKRDVTFSTEFGTLFTEKDFALLLTYHPAAALYNPKLIPRMEEIFKNIPTYIPN